MNLSYGAWELCGLLFDALKLSFRQIVCVYVDVYGCERVCVFVCCESTSPISSNLNIFSSEHRIALQYLLLPVVLFKTFASNLEYI